MERKEIFEYSYSNFLFEIQVEKIKEEDYKLSIKEKSDIEAAFEITFEELSKENKDKLKQLGIKPKELFFLFTESIRQKELRILRFKGFIKIDFIIKRNPKEDERINILIPQKNYDFISNVKGISFNNSLNIIDCFYLLSNGKALIIEKTEGDIPPYFKELLILNKLLLICNSFPLIIYFDKHSGKFSVFELKYDTNSDEYTILLGNDMHILILKLDALNKIEKLYEHHLEENIYCSKSGFFWNNHNPLFKIWKNNFYFTNEYIIHSLSLTKLNDDDYKQIDVYFYMNNIKEFDLEYTESFDNCIDSFIIKDNLLGIIQEMPDNQNKKIIIYEIKNFQKITYIVLNENISDEFNEIYYVQWKNQGLICTYKHILLLDNEEFKVEEKAEIKYKMEAKIWNGIRFKNCLLLKYISLNTEDKIIINLDDYSMFSPKTTFVFEEFVFSNANSLVVKIGESYLFVDIIKNELKKKEEGNNIYIDLKNNEYLIGDFELPLELISHKELIYKSINEATGKITLSLDDYNPLNRTNLYIGDFQKKKFSGKIVSKEDTLNNQSYFIGTTNELGRPFDGKTEFKDHFRTYKGIWNKGIGEGKIISDYHSYCKLFPDIKIEFEGTFDSFGYPLKGKGKWFIFNHILNINEINEKGEWIGYINSDFFKKADFTARPNYENDPMYIEGELNNLTEKKKPISKVIKIKFKLSNEMLINNYFTFFYDTGEVFEGMFKDCKNILDILKGKGVVYDSFYNLKFDGEFMRNEKDDIFKKNKLIFEGQIETEDLLKEKQIFNGILRIDNFYYDWMRGNEDYFPYFMVEGEGEMIRHRKNIEVCLTGKWKNEMAEGKVIYDKEYEYKGTYEYTGFPITGEGYFISISKQKKIIYNGKWENRNGKGTITLPDGKEIETEWKFGCLGEYPYLLKGEYISNISHKSSSWFK